MKLTEQQKSIQKYLKQALDAAKKARKGAYHYSTKYDAKPIASADFSENKKS